MVAYGVELEVTEKLIEIWPFKDMPLHVQRIARVHFNWPVHKIVQNDVNVDSFFFSFVWLIYWSLNVLT